MDTKDVKKEKLEPQVKSVDMSDDMQQEAIDIAQEAMEKYTIEKVRLPIFPSVKYRADIHQRTLRNILRESSMRRKAQHGIA